MKNRCEFWTPEWSEELGRSLTWEEHHAHKGKPKPGVERVRYSGDGNRKARRAAKITGAA